MKKTRYTLDIEVCEETLTTMNLSQKEYQEQLKRLEQSAINTLDSEIVTEKLDHRFCEISGFMFEETTFLRTTTFYILTKITRL